MKNFQKLDFNFDWWMGDSHPPKYKINNKGDRKMKLSEFKNQLDEINKRFKKLLAEETNYDKKLEILKAHNLATINLLNKIKATNENK